MKERPIIFSGPMVRAILAGTKTQTRRPVKPQPEPYGEPDSWWHPATEGEPQWGAHLSDAIKWVCPYGQPGDRLWVREEWHIAGSSKHHSEPFQRIHVAYRPHSQMAIKGGHRVDGKTFHLDPNTPYPCSSTPSHRKDGAIRWRPSIHMPRWACRLVLEIVSVRVELLKDITIADAQAEGFDGHGAIIPFIQTWERMYGNRGLGCDANPWVWVVGLKRVEVAA